MVVQKIVEIQEQLSRTFFKISIGKRDGQTIIEGMIRVRYVYLDLAQRVMHWLYFPVEDLQGIVCLKCRGLS